VQQDTSGASQTPERPALGVGKAVIGTLPCIIQLLAPRQWHPATGHRIDVFRIHRASAARIVAALGGGNAMLGDIIADSRATSPGIRGELPAPCAWLGCGGALRKIGDEVTETLNYVPAEEFVPDSPLEEGGFEPSVPLSKSRLLIARASPHGGCFSNPEAASVSTDLSAVYRDDSCGDHPRVTRHRGNCCRMLDLQRGGHLFRYHAGRLGPG
jgi:hypothetical protein